MYDTKKKELRWNATYFDYAATLPDEDIKYSKDLIAVFPPAPAIGPGFCIQAKILWFFTVINRLNCLSWFLCSWYASAGFYPSHAVVARAR